MASVINPILVKMAEHLVADTDLTTVAIGHKNHSQRELPAGIIWMDEGQIIEEINSTFDVEYPLIVSVKARTFDSCNEIVEALASLWRSGTNREELRALGVIAVSPSSLFPSAFVPETEDDIGFVGEMVFQLRVRHTY